MFLNNYLIYILFLYLISIDWKSIKLSISGLQIFENENLKFCLSISDQIMALLSSFRFSLTITRYNGCEAPPGFSFLDAFFGSHPLFLAIGLQ